MLGAKKVLKEMMNLGIAHKGRTTGGLGLSRAFPLVVGNMEEESGIRGVTR